MAAKYAKSINFEAVWISPLRRALQTAYYIFKDHPNFHKINFKVQPILREKVRWASDLPSMDVLSMLETEFMPKFKGRLDINLVEEACNRVQSRDDVKVFEK